MADFKTQKTSGNRGGCPKVVFPVSDHEDVSIEDVSIEDVSNHEDVSKFFCLCPAAVVLNVSDEVSSESCSTGNTIVVLHRVPRQVRSRNTLIYEPLVVSLGPYHYSNNQYDDFKNKVVRLMLGTPAKSDLADEIQTRVAEIRIFYEPIHQVMGCFYRDEVWVEMMLRDACLIVYNMSRVLQDPDIVLHATQNIGALGVTLMANDFSKLENQIPWWIVTSLITSKYGESEGKTFICKYLSYANFWDFDKVKEFPWEFPPPHLLEARRRIFLTKQGVSESEQTIITTILTSEVLRSPFRSATELRAKGIHFTRSSDFLDDITFVSHSLHGVLHLPVLRVDSETATFLSNVIVLEMSPGNTRADFPVTSYVNFMKSLIETQNDVKLLQEKGIIVSYLMGNEEIVGVFKVIDTHEVDNFDIFRNIKEEINRHCNNRGKTWMAELFDTYFRSPWTALAVFAAAFLLCLTFLQTFYTLNPVN